MIKGCNKRVIVMKETGNAMIEEAFFILKPEAGKAAVSESDIIKQANHILEKSIYDERFSHLSMNVAKKRDGSGKFGSFWSGIVIGAIVTAGFFLVL
ncbi:MAG: hypothetical protein IJZ20_08320 [Clostridia bacterium]|nr:hypothetical protein [Clostridia bacterium]